MKDYPDRAGRSAARPSVPERTGIWSGGVDLAVLLLVITIVVTVTLTAMGARIGDALHELVVRLG